LTAIENQKEGKMYLVEEKDTDLGNGTKIIIPIKDDDREMFEKKCYLATGFWAVKPEYINFKSTFTTESIFNFKDIDSVKDVEIIKNTWTDDNGYSPRSLITSTSLLIDEIVYPLDGDKIGEVLPDAPFFIKFKTGELTLSANRETVQYDRQTIKKIKRKYRSLTAHYTKKINEFFETCPTRWEATMTAYEMVNTSGYEFSPLPYVVQVLGLNKESEVFSYKGKKLDWKLSQFPQFNFLLVKKGYKRYEVFNKLSEFFNTLPLVYMDANKFSKARNETLFTQGQDQYILITHVNRNLLNFSSLNFHAKKRIAHETREMINNWKSLTEDYGLKPINYSEVEKADVVYEKNAAGKVVKQKKMIDCRLFDMDDRCNIKDLLKFNVDKIELKIHQINGSNEVDIKDCVVWVVDSLKDLKGIEGYSRRSRHGKSRKDWTREKFEVDTIIKELGYKVVLAVSRKFSPNFAQFTKIETIINSKEFEKKVRPLVSKTVWNNFKYSTEADFLKKFSFKDAGINQALKEMTKIKTDSDNVPQFYKDRYNLDTSLVDEYNVVIEKILDRYPILKLADSEYDLNYKKIKISHVQDYITLMDNAVTFDGQADGVNSKVLTGTNN
jgi:hypothetical protein